MIDMIDAQKPQLALDTLLGAGRVQQHSEFHRRIGVSDEVADRPSDQTPSSQPEQFTGSQVGSRDGLISIEQQVASRRALEQLTVLAASFLRFELRTPQLFVLHLELDLVHLELLSQLLEL